MTIIRVGALLCAIAFLSACGKPLVYNENFPTAGPMFIEPAAPAPAPEPEPEPVMSTAEQNVKAIESFTEVGLEAEQTERGVNVYLPPEIYFQGASTAIDLEARAKIAQIAVEVNKDYLLDRNIEVVGHTDSTGSDSTNRELSKKRALAATGELVFSRVDRIRLIPKWMGESSPRYPELNPDGSINEDHRNRNRRVEFTILNPDA